jgi:hypothetical protein
MRLILMLVAVLIAGCQSTKEPDYSVKEKVCDARGADSGYCIPGEYE